MSQMKSYSFQGKRAVIRVDFNVPLHKETLEVQDDKRIKAALPTINWVLNHGGSVVLLSHFGRPKNGPEDRFSLRHVLVRLQELLGVSVAFSLTLEEGFLKSKELNAGDIMLMENVRFFKGETENNSTLSAEFAKLGDCFINDAFGSAHRAHSSTTGIASFFPNDRMMGFLMEEELNNAQRVLSNPSSPFTAIIGGAKVSDKMLIIENLVSIASDIIIGGGMAYTFAQAMGGQIGNSLVEEDRLDNVKTILSQANQKGVRLHLPVDSVIADSFSADASTQITSSHHIPKGWMGLDIGPNSIDDFKKVILSSKTVLWNGPMGVFEWEPFSRGTRDIALAVAEATSLGAYSLIGGGDSASAIAQFALVDKVSYVSTGGGALLELFEGKELPGIKALD
ncbi:MAG: phosphoglycerate kinase [Bacteroidetes bacterium]|nr:phosphoglycerate kinase [Bacteroidota bacterium]